MGIDLKSIYRGIVKNNQDPENKGRVRIFIPGIFSSEFVEDSEKTKLLPWAEPAMPIFGGSWKNPKFGEGDYPDQLNEEVGICSVPHGEFKIPFEGAQVWVFFENGSRSKPVYFAVCQSGPGWFAEHEAQHIIKTDNVRIRIDEQPIIDKNEENSKCGKSSCAFPTFNDKCTKLSKELHHKKLVPARVDVEIWNEGLIGLNLIIKGDVNLKVEGNMYEHIIGDKHITHEGNLYYKHVGDSQIDQEGFVSKFLRGELSDIHKGDATIKLDGNITETINGNSNLNVMKNLTENIELNYTRRTNLMDRAFAGISYARKSMWQHNVTLVDNYSYSMLMIRKLSGVLFTVMSLVSSRMRSLVDTRISSKVRLLIDSVLLLDVKCRGNLSILSDLNLIIHSKIQMVINSGMFLMLSAKSSVLAGTLGLWNFVKKYTPFVSKEIEDFPDDFPL